MNQKDRTQKRIKSLELIPEENRSRAEKAELVLLHKELDRVLASSPTT